LIRWSSLSPRTSRGGLSTKIHTLTDQRCCPVTVILTPGQSGDNPQLVPLLDLHRRQQPRGRGRRFRVFVAEDADDVGALPGRDGDRDGRWIPD